MSGNGNPSYRHGHWQGKRSSKEYDSWAHMIDRCTNPDSKSWDRYGGRGISVCDRWRLFDNFLEDMGPKPGPDYQIERTNNNGNYEPGNCVWATRRQQCRNRSTTININYHNKTQCLKDWANELGVPYLRMYYLYKKGTPVSVLLDNRSYRNVAKRP